MSLKLLGLPGLYQNWLMSSLDTGCDYKIVHNHTNFIYAGTKITWCKKLEVDFDSVQDDIVINLYVKPENFVWYLYNFLEKTDNVGIQVKHLHTHLFTRAPNTIAFDGMLKHFVESYGVNENTDIETVKNSLIEYFYFTLVQEHEFKSKVAQEHPRFINVEYDDFASYDQLVAKLENVPGFDLTYFTNMYTILKQTNFEYLNKKKQYQLHLTPVDLDILEIAYAGSTVANDLDWFNEQVRENTLKEKIFV